MKQFVRNPSYSQDGYITERKVIVIHLPSEICVKDNSSEYSI
jgi:hypothetical protein